VKEVLFSDQSEPVCQNLAILYYILVNIEVNAELTLGGYIRSLRRILVFSLFQLSGVAMVIVGVWTLFYEKEYHLFLGSTRYLIIVGLMIGLGGVVILICFCGCYGTYKEHRYMLMTVRQCPGYTQCTLLLHHQLFN